MRLKNKLPGAPSDDASTGYWGMPHGVTRFGETPEAFFQLLP